MDDSAKAEALSLVKERIAKAVEDALGGEFFRQQERIRELSEQNAMLRDRLLAVESFERGATSGVFIDERHAREYHDAAQRLMNHVLGRATAGEWTFRHAEMLIELLDETSERKRRKEDWSLSDVDRSRSSALEEIAQLCSAYLDAQADAVVASRDSYSWKGPGDPRVREAIEADERRSAAHEKLVRALRKLVKP